MTKAGKTELKSRDSRQKGGKLLPPYGRKRIRIEEPVYESERGE